MQWLREAHLNQLEKTITKKVLSELGQQTVSAACADEAAQSQHKGKVRRCQRPELHLSAAVEISYTRHEPTP